MRQVVFLTGASGEIGQSIAKTMANNGCAVALGYYNNINAANALCKELVACGHSAAVYGGNIANATQVDAMFAKAEEELGYVDILINNAGIAKQQMFCDISENEWRQMMDVHVTGAFLCCRRVLPNMVKRKKGVIVNIASMWGQVGASCEVHYSTAKAALIGMTKALAKEFAPSGVRVNCVAPGAVKGGMMSEFNGEEVKALCEEIPMSRLGNPDEIAAAVAFLAMDSASYITGQVLAPNGGMVV